MPTTEDARRRVDKALVHALNLPKLLHDIVAIALVGSWARDAGRDNSDLDLVVLTDRPDIALSSDGWTSVFGETVEVVRRADFGRLQERRLRLADGLVVEICIGDRTWANTSAVDEGTERVARDGLRPLHDPHGLLQKLLGTVGPA